MISRTVRALFPALPALAAFILAARPVPAAGPNYTVRKLPLPGGPAAILMDYIAFDPATRFVWAPAGNTGAVDVVDTADDTIRQITDLPTAEMGTGDRKRRVGPSSVTIGEGWVYVGNRADSSVCAFHPRSLARGACHRLDAMPDGLAYVAATKEVWVTTPRDKSIRILDAEKLEQKARLELDGNPEGFVVDAKRERFYTNLEDKDRTIGINLRTRKTVAVWKPSCGADGPRGLRLDPETTIFSSRARPRGDARHQVGRKGDLDARHRRGSGRSRLLSRHPLVVRRRREGRTAHDRPLGLGRQPDSRGDREDSGGRTQSRRHRQGRGLSRPFGSG